jgi:hypothetical protein
MSDPYSYEIASLPQAHFTYAAPRNDMIFNVEVITQKMSIINTPSKPSSQTHQFF